MSNRKVIIIAIITVLTALLVNVLFGGVLAAKLSTVNLFGRYQLVKPAAPIVINKTEQVRANDSEDIISAVDRTKSKVSVLVYRAADNSMRIAGGAVNIASDGFFLTVRSAVQAAGSSQLYVVTSDGKTYPATAGFTDPATNLVMVKTDARGIAVADLGKPEDLTSGSRLVFLSASAVPYASRFTASFVSFPMSDISGQIFDSDRPGHTFGAQPVSGIFAGQAVVNLSGEVVGIFDGTTVITNTVIRPASSAFLERKNTLVRPAYGFKYRVIGPTESAVLGIPQGAQAIKPASGTPAQAGGLADGDIITNVGDTKVEGANTLEVLLQRYKPGDNVEFSVTRGSSNIKIIVKPGNL